MRGLTQRNLFQKVKKKRIGAGMVVLLESFHHNLLVIQAMGREDKNGDL